MARRSRKPSVTAPIEDLDVPPSRHPARRTICWTIGLLLLLIATRIAWGRLADRQFNAAVAEFSPRHPLPEQNELRPASTSDSNTPAFFLDRAAGRMDLQHWFETEPDIDLLQPLSNDAIENLKKLRATYLTSLADVRRARELAGGHASVSEGWEGLDEAAVRARLSRLHDLGWLLQCAVAYSHATADDAASMDEARDLLFVAGAIRHAPSDLGPLIAMSSEVMGSEELALIGEELRINQGPRSASVAQVKSLIHDLLAEPPIQRSMQTGLAAQASELVAWIVELPNGTSLRWPPSRAWSVRRQTDEAPERVAKLIARVERPYFEMQAARLLRNDNAVLSALNGSGYASIVSRLPVDYAPPRGDNFFGMRLVGDFESTSDGRWVKYCFMAGAARPLLAADLAIRLYGLDHGGRLPTALEELEPRYLPRVPQDPYAAAGIPIRYLPGAQRPCVYSVGENGVDDAAAGTWTIPIVVLPGDRYRLPDIVWHVGPPLPKATPATQPATGGL